MEEQSKKKHKYITRIDYNSHGYWCRIHRLGVNKFFADSKFGGKIEALNAALLWRNKQTGGILDEESETGVKGLNIRRRKSKDGRRTEQRRRNSAKNSAVAVNSYNRYRPVALHFGHISRFR